ncbi:hypothetical protein PpBr36_03417 [Pyricularia pennisetigena]|uniref:hypothetical protein n=1 Tax=Pyricularia pennisetigena TaxID=1578925 RepID=UPI001154C637|nr:hypothetical protein PpBr36_03417 [Pyricularia pennisetigena]TLS31302.1 hypothetical protein PpBr36_03417 [Pyricularia pennisetigena]
MASLDSLKLALRHRAATATQTLSPLSEAQYSAGFDMFVKESGWAAYQDFIIPQLSRLIASLLDRRVRLSVLEIGPGPKTVLGYLPEHQRQGITRYVAYEPSTLFAAELEKGFQSGSGLEVEVPLPRLKTPPEIRRMPFDLDGNNRMDEGEEAFDLVLFCHSMYGMHPKRKFVERALAKLDGRFGGAMVVVFHRAGKLHLDGLVCHSTATFPSGVIRVMDDDELLDAFARFVAGYVVDDIDEKSASILSDWRGLCRALGRREGAHPNLLRFSAPEVMVALTRHASSLPELTANVPLLISSPKNKIKNRQARLHRPAATFRPTEIRHIQECVKWALKNKTNLTIVSGSHSDHCLWPNVVAVDMGSFDKVHICRAGDGKTTRAAEESDVFVVAETGAKTGDIITNIMAAGLTVPLGSRPSVGAGLWLQGGIGHLTRLHGLTCDSIVGAVMVGVSSGQVLCVGNVPISHQPAGSERPENETDLLWAIRGGGTNFGIVVSVTFKTYAKADYSVRNWIVPLAGDAEAHLKLQEFDELVAAKFPRHCSADAYLYWDMGQMHLGVTMYEAFNNGLALQATQATRVGEILGQETYSTVVDGVGLFDTEMYMSGMHGGHGGGKTSSFKRCMFLRHIGSRATANILLDAIKNRPSPLCYLHLLHGGAAVTDVAADSSAFGCRDWDFACVITGVWPRDQDGTQAAETAMQWVYDVVGSLLPLSIGIYGADLGPDPRDAALATKAFGPNLARLARLKSSCDPREVLAYAFPLPRVPTEPIVIIIVTGMHGAGKDYCAEIWASVFNNKSSRKGPTACATSISEAIKREYAEATGADFDRLLSDRPYKEQHRTALNEFFKNKMQRRPRLPEEHFLKVVRDAAPVNVLFITGMREQAPVAALSHLVPNSKLVEVRVIVSEETRQVRRGFRQNRAVGGSNCAAAEEETGDKGIEKNRLGPMASSDCPSFIFENNIPGSKAAVAFAQDHLLPLIDKGLQRLAQMIRSVPDHPREGIEFRHVLDIAQRPGGLDLCSSLLQRHLAGDWAKVDALVCCEAGGFLFASALSTRVDIPLVLIREAGKLPPPTISTSKFPSHISSPVLSESKSSRIEMDLDALSPGASVVVVDDVLATGRTLCAVLQLLKKAGVHGKNVSVIVVAEFPCHRGRDALRQHGFAETNLQNLLVFGGP